MLNGKTIAVVIPALNEEESVSRVVREIPACVDRIIVVDNGSSDDTGTAAINAGAQVVREDRSGYGAACQAGIAAAGKADLLAFIDADYSDYPQDLQQLIEAVACGGADFAVGARVPEAGAPAALPPHQRFGNRLACYLIRHVHGHCFDDLGPMRCIRRDRLEQLGMSDPDFGWTAEMQVKAVRSGLRIVELPVRYRRRVGRSKISGTVKGSVLAAWKILLWTARPLRQGSPTRA